MKNRQNGYIALVAVLTICAIVLAATITIAVLGIGEAQSSLSLANGEQTLQSAEGCMEDGLVKARNNNSYSGGNITRPEGTCIITVAKNGNNWTLTASTSATTYLRTIQVQITRGQTASLSAWQEL